MGFFAKGTFLPSRLPLTRELPSVSEAEGEKDYPSVTCGDSSPDKGSQERGEAYCVPNYPIPRQREAYPCFNFKKIKIFLF